jgi:hypothetical protein
MSELLTKQEINRVSNIISRAADRNIIVYDNEAKCGRLTKRLIPLMKLIFEQNRQIKGAYPTRILLPSTAKVDIALWGDWREDIWLDWPTPVFGLKPSFYDSFDADYKENTPGYIKGFFDKGYQLASGDTCLAIITNEDETEVLMGSY